MRDSPTVYAFALSLGLGLLLGLERERRPQTKAGLRTFALTAVLGTASALLAERTGGAWILPAGLLAAALTMIAADRSRTEGPDTTTTVALLLCYAYGAMVWYGYAELSVALVLATTALLYFKTELHEVPRHLSRQDIVSFLQFAVISFIVLPLLPDRGFGPYEALNPYRIWLMVVLIAGIGLAGYVALRLGAGRRGPVLFGLLGGLVSSTATTLVYARQVGTARERSEPALVVMVTANLMQFPRLLGVAGVVSPRALPALALLLGLGLLVGALPLWRIRRLGGDMSGVQEHQVRNPLEMWAALSFGGIYAIVLLVTAWTNAHAGAQGLYAVAPVVGVTDMDAMLLSALRLFGAGKLSAPQAATGVALALAANMTVKVGIAWAAGTRALALRLGLCFVPALAGLAAGVALLR